MDIRGNDVSINADVTANANNGDKGIYVLGGNDVTVAGTLTADGGTALDIDIDAKMNLPCPLADSTPTTMYSSPQLQTM